jgi:hypothetical protein
MAADNVLEFKALEGAGMFFAALGPDLDMVGGHLFALFLEDGNDVGGSAAS